MNKDNDDCLRASKQEAQRGSGAVLQVQMFRLEPRGDG